jgi:phospholipid/cholesterol/gamma-HCH transport system ATP-binding protein
VNIADRAGQRCAIRVRELHKAFGTKIVLDGVDLEIPRGASTVIIGGSGSGKSVLLKHIIGLMRPDSGSVEVEGVAISELGNRDITRFRRRFGMAFQEGALFDSMTVEQNVAFPLVRQGELRPGEIRARVAECLAEVGLAEAAQKMPSQLSGGMRRRVGFARAVANQPEILLFDEPTTGLDPVTKGTIDDLIVELRENLGSTTVTITHDMESVFRIADWVGMLYGGRIIVWAPPEELKSIDDERLQAFISRGQQEARVGH